MICVATVTEQKQRHAEEWKLAQDQLDILEQNARIDGTRKARNNGKSNTRNDAN